jgi:hypothetical protein
VAALQILALLSQLPAELQTELAQARGSRRTLSRLVPQARRVHGRWPRAPRRLFWAANRSGKSETAAYELTAHLTGLYPTWWTGYVSDRPITAWAFGDTMLTTRDIVQVALLGPTDGVALHQWDGMIPAHLIYDTTRKR